MDKGSTAQTFSFKVVFDGLMLLIGMHVSVNGWHNCGKFTKCLMNGKQGTEEENIFLHILTANI